MCVFVCTKRHTHTHTHQGSEKEIAKGSEKETKKRDKDLHERNHKTIQQSVVVVATVPATTMYELNFFSQRTECVCSFVRPIGTMCAVCSFHFSLSSSPSSPPFPSLYVRISFYGTITQLTVTDRTLLRHGRSWTQAVVLFCSRSVFFAQLHDAFAFLRLIRARLLLGSTSLYATANVRERQRWGRPGRRKDEKLELNNIFVANNKFYFATFNNILFFSSLFVFGFSSSSWFYFLAFAWLLSPCSLFAAIKFWNILRCFIFFFALLFCLFVFPMPAMP